MVMNVWFLLNNPIKPCSVFDKICSYAATTNIKITEIIPFTEKTNVKNRTFLVLMDVMSLDTNIPQNEGILKLSVTKHVKISTKISHPYTLLAGNALNSPQRKFLPLIWKALPTKPWNCSGHKDSSFDSFGNIFMAYIETTTLSKLTSPNY